MMLELANDADRTSAVNATPPGVAVTIVTLQAAASVVTPRLSTDTILTAAARRLTSITLTDNDNVAIVLNGVISVANSNTVGKSTQCMCTLADRASIVDCNTLAVNTVWDGKIDNVTESRLPETAVGDNETLPGSTVAALAVALAARTPTMKLTPPANNVAGATVTAPTKAGD